MVSAGVSLAALVAVCLVAVSHCRPAAKRSAVADYGDLDEGSGDAIDAPPPQPMAALPPLARWDSDGERGDTPNAMTGGGEPGPKPPAVLSATATKPEGKPKPSVGHTQLYSNVQPARFPGQGGRRPRVHGHRVAKQSGTYPWTGPYTGAGLGAAAAHGLEQYAAGGTMQPAVQAPLQAQYYGGLPQPVAMPPYFYPPVSQQQPPMVLFGGPAQYAQPIDPYPTYAAYGGCAHADYWPPIGYNGPTIDRYAQQLQPPVLPQYHYPQPQAPAYDPYALPMEHPASDIYASPYGQYWQPFQQ